MEMVLKETMHGVLHEYCSAFSIKEKKDNKNVTEELDTFGVLPTGYGKSVFLLPITGAEQDNHQFFQILSIILPLEGHVSKNSELLFHEKLLKSKS